MWTAVVLLFSSSAWVSSLPSQHGSVSNQALETYADSGWFKLTRSRIGGDAGLIWNVRSGHWQLNGSWAHADDPAHPAYEFEPDLRGALALAAVTGNVNRLSEIADFFSTFLVRFRPISEVLARSKATNGHSKLLPEGPPEALVLPTLDRGWPSECALCTAQAMHPAARLLHLIALTPPARRTESMLRFSTSFTPLLARDVVIRFAYQTHWPYNGPDGRPYVLADEWSSELSRQGGNRYRMLDRDLWLIGIAAEVLSAHHADAGLVPLTGTDSVKLRRFVDLGVQMIVAREHPHEVARTDGSHSTADLLFSGEFDSDPDMAYAADTSHTYPEPADRAPPHNGGWDLSHSQRVPAVLRSLWDARGALALSFPDSAALARVADQYLYVVYRPGWPGPQFNNFFDGGDGWYRVGMNGKREDFTYAPAAFCDNADPTRHCLSRGAASGWQLLRFAEPGLGQIAQQLFALAQDTVPADTMYRRRVWEASDDPLRLVETPSRRYSPLLVQIIGEYLLGGHAELSQ